MGAGWRGGCERRGRKYVGDTTGAQKLRSCRLATLARHLEQYLFARLVDASTFHSEIVRANEINVHYKTLYRVTIFTIPFVASSVAHRSALSLAVQMNISGIGIDFRAISLPYFITFIARMRMVPGCTVANAMQPHKFIRIFDPSFSYSPSASCSLFPPATGSDSRGACCRERLAEHIAYCARRRERM